MPTVARNPFGTRGLEARRWRSSAPRPPGWGTARDSSIAGRGASRVRRASRPTARVLDSYPAARTPARANGEAVQTFPRANPDNSCGVAESNPTTSSIPASLGSAIVKPVDVMPTTTSFAFGFTSRRYCASAGADESDRPTSRCRCRSRRRRRGSWSPVPIGSATRSPCHRTAARRWCAARLESLTRTDRQRRELRATTEPTSTCRRGESHHHVLRLGRRSHQRQRRRHLAARDRHSRDRCAHRARHVETQQVRLTRRLDDAEGA